MGILNKIFGLKSKNNESDSLDFKNSDCVLEIVVKLHKEIWTDLKKWDENHHKIKEYLTKLLSENPNDTRALTNLGAILSDTGKHKEALTELKKAKKLGTNDANLYRNIGIAKLNIETERQNAKKCFEIANQMEPNELTIEAYFDPHGH